MTDGQRAADAVHELTVPSGAVFTGPTARAAWAKFAEHSRAAIAGGVCPRHGSRLEPFPAEPGCVSGACVECLACYVLEPATGAVRAAPYLAGSPP
jgi:hypothetical protein